MLDKFNKDIINAMKEKDTLRLTVLRMVKGSLQLEAINNHKELSDELLIEAFSKQLKLREDSLEQLINLNREDLASKVREEIAIIKEYMPREFTKEEVDAILDEVFEDVKPNGMKDFGNIMGIVAPKVKGRSNMKDVTELIKSRLNNL